MQAMFREWPQAGKISRPTGRVEMQSHAVVLAASLEAKRVLMEREASHTVVDGRNMHQELRQCRDTEAP